MITEVSPLATVVLDGSGGGQCAVGPPSGTKWALRLATVATSTATKQPQAKFYRGSASGPIELLDFTYTGASASSGKVGGAVYYPGQRLWAVWSGGDAGATATLQAYGQQGNRADPLPPSPLTEGFANNTATIVVAGGSGAQIVITTVIPAEITAFYGAQGWSVVAGIFYYFNATDYWYEIDLNPATVQLHATGFGIGGVVHENELNQWIAGGPNIAKFIGLNQIISTQYGRPGRTPDPNDHFNIADSATLNINGAFKVQDAALASLLDNLATRVKLAASVTGDTNDRFEILTSGKQQWGPGNAAVDTVLYRSAAGKLAVDQLLANVAGAAETKHAFPYANSWADAGGGKAGLTYWKTAENKVALIGTAHSPNPFNATLGTLPAGYRPTNQQGIFAWTNEASGQLLTVGSTGAITAFGSTTIAKDWWINGEFSLDL